jgi:Na+-driven multidrug efflux pump
MNTFPFLWMFAMGISSASSALIGKEIGRNDIKKAKLYYKAT